MCQARIMKHVQPIQTIVTTSLIKKAKTRYDHKYFRKHVTHLKIQFQQLQLVVKQVVKLYCAENQMLKFNSENVSHSRKFLFSNFTFRRKCSRIHLFNPVYQLEIFISTTYWAKTCRLKNARPVITNHKRQYMIFRAQSSIYSYYGY